MFPSASKVFEELMLTILKKYAMGAFIGIEGIAHIGHCWSEGSPVVRWEALEAVFVMISFYNL